MAVANGGNNPFGQLRGGAALANKDFTKFKEPVQASPNRAKKGPDNVKKGKKKGKKNSKIKKNHSPRN